MSFSPPKPPKGLGKRPPWRSLWRSRLPKPPEASWAPGSKTYLPTGELMQNALVRSDAWRENWLPVLESKADQWGAGRLFSLLDFECIFLAQIEQGEWYLASFRENFLTGDQGRLTREQLGLVAERMIWREGVVNSLNVPSQATLSRAFNFISMEERAALARATFERLRDEALAMPEFEGCDEILYVDGYDLFITGRPPKKTGPHTPQDELESSEDEDADD